MHAVVVFKCERLRSTDALRTHCRTLIARYKGPRSMVFVPASPLSLTGKALKTELRALDGRPFRVPTKNMR